ncbi:YitT family protein [Candidatus Thioglobus sp.]|nr:YitT family protein [Candidatus Thioglobus sp.]
MKLISETFTIKKIPKVVWSSEDSFNLKPKLLTFVFLVFGLFLFGLGESLLITSGAGVGPYTVLAQGISNLTNWSLGLSTFVISVFVLMLWIPLKQKPGMGTILNAFIIALTIEFSVYFLPYPEYYPLKVLQVVIGVFTIGIGSGFYLICNLGAGPRDGLMMGLQKVTNMPIYSIRTTIEISVVILGSIFLLNNLDKLLGEVVGLGTVIFALGIGPSVALGITIVGRFSKKA